MVLGPQAVQSRRIGLADEGGEPRVEAQGVMVVKVFVAEGQSVDVLAEELERRVFDGLGMAMVREAGGERAEDPREAFGFAEEEGTAVGGDGPAVKACQHVAGAEGLEGEGGLGTLCRQEVASGEKSKGLVQIPLRFLRQPRFIPR